MPNLYHDLRLPAKQAWQGNEHSLQKHIITRCQLITGMYPELALIHAIPNGGQRNIIVARKLKAEGVKPGVPDLCLPVPIEANDSYKQYHGLYIELKKAGGSPNTHQKEWLNNLTKQGYFCAVSNSEAVTMDIIESYLCGKITSLLETHAK